MNAKLFAILFAVAGVLGAWSETYLAAAVFAVLYLLFTFLKLKNEEMRFVLLSASGLPIILASGNPLFTGIVSALLLISLLAVGNILGKKTAILAVLAGVVAGVCAMQSAAVVAVVIAAGITAIGVYILFIAEYRLRKQFTVNPHENQ